MKKVLRIAICLLLSAVLFVGCDKGSGSAGEAEQIEVSAVTGFTLEKEYDATAYLDTSGIVKGAAYTLGSADGDDVDITVTGTSLDRVGQGAGKLTVSYGDTLTGADAGKYKISAGSFELPVTVNAKKLTSAMLVLPSSVPYIGGDYTPGKIVSYTVAGEERMTADDYDVEYFSDREMSQAVTPPFTSAGTYYYKVTGKGNFTGTVSGAVALSSTPVADLKVEYLGIEYAEHDKMLAFAGQAFELEKLNLVSDTYTQKFNIRWQVSDGETWSDVDIYGGDVLFDTAGEYTLRGEIDNRGELTGATAFIGSCEISVSVMANKKAYYDEMIKLDTAESILKTVTDSGNVATSVEYLADDGEGNKVASISYRGLSYHPTSTTDTCSYRTVKFQFGGVYTMGEISEIRFKMKRNPDQTSVNSWAQVWVNRQYLDTQFAASSESDKYNIINQNKIDPTFNLSDAKWADYTTYTISQAMILKLGYNGMTEEEKLNMKLEDVAFGASGDAKVAYLYISDIELVTKEQVKAELAEDLKLNSAASVAKIVTDSGNSDTSIEYLADDGDGNSVASIHYAGVSWANSANDNCTYRTVKFQLGSIYTIGEISEIRFTMKANPNQTSPNKWAQVWVNRQYLDAQFENSSAEGDDKKAIINDDNVKINSTFNASQAAWANYTTYTITQEMITSRNYNGMTAEEKLNMKLEDVAFGANGSAGGAYLYIKSIEIVLKDAAN